tara:strand:+ start:516 stop:914 length:399 start_codon:yes stop_codon:yes gene_type:complete
MEDETTPLIRNNNNLMNNDMKHMIMERIRQSYEKDINENLESRSRCRKLGNSLQTLSQFISVGATIMAFSAGFYDDKMLSFISGCLGSLSLAFLKTSDYALNESRERTESLNIILKKLNIDTIPDVVVQQNN